MNKYLVILVAFSISISILLVGSANHVTADIDNKTNINKTSDEVKIDGTQQVREINNEIGMTILIGGSVMIFVILIISAVIIRQFRPTDDD